MAARLKKPCSGRLLRCFFLKLINAFLIVVCSFASQAQAAAPENDQCENAYRIGIGRFNDTLAGATNDGSSSVGEPDGPDVWYLFQAGAGGVLQVTTCGTHDLPGRDEGLDSVLSLHSEAPGTSENELGANDNWTSDGDWGACAGADTSQAGDAAVQLEVTCGQTVWIRVSRADGETDGDFLLNVHLHAGSMPDQCAEAVAVCEGSFAFSNEGATTDGPDEAEGCNFNGYTNIEADVWFCYTPGSTGTARIDLCGSTFNTKMAVYEGCSCGGGRGPLLACNDDSGPDECGQASVVSFPVTASESCLIRVGGFDGAQGSGVMNISCQASAPEISIIYCEPLWGSYLGGMPFEMNGSGFTDATRVYFGDRELVETTFVNENTIMGEVPPYGGLEVETPVPIRCEDPEHGEAFFDDPFTYFGPLRIDSVEPGSFVAGEGGSFVISGTGFTPQTLILVGETEPVEQFFLNTFAIEGVLPDLGPGTYDLTVEDWLVDGDTPTLVTDTLPDAITLAYGQPDMPQILSIGSFVLTAVAYTDYQWQPLDGVFTSVAGTAFTSFTCGPDILTDVLVSFSELTVRPDEPPFTGTVLEGTAEYPTASPMPPTLGSAIETFPVLIEQLTLNPSGSTAQLKVELHPTLVDPATCSVAVLDLGEVPVEANGVCSVAVNRPLDAFGPWRLGGTGMAISGTGWTCDLSTTWSLPGFPSSWRGVVLTQGQTVAAASGTVISNTGYLKAPYSFSGAVITSQGLEDIFTLSTSWSFKTLEPLDYDVSLNQGSLQVSQSTVIGGSFTSGTISLPRNAARPKSGTSPITASYTTLTVQTDLDLYAEVSIAETIRWGEFTTLSQPLPFYAAKRANDSGSFKGYMYFASAYTAPYCPVTAGTFTDLDPDTSNMAYELESNGLQGCTTCFETNGTQPYFVIETPDIPDPSKPIVGFIAHPSVITIGSAGVHGTVIIETLIAAETPTPTLLGPTTNGTYYETDKEGDKKPFSTTFTLGDAQLMKFQFADSAVYESDAKGDLALKGATDATIGIKSMIFTSTAHLAGASVEIKKGTKVKYWDLTLVQKADAASAGVVNFKSGQIFLTQAGLWDGQVSVDSTSGAVTYKEVHFAMPFYFLWSVLFASGNWGELVFDYNNTGQTFDGFTYTPGVVALSKYDPKENSPSEKAYLQTGGNIHFGFFGQTYLHIHDFYKNDASQPYYNRLVELQETADAALGIKASDLDIKQTWGDKFGEMEFTIEYDDADQDGFCGQGTSGLLFIDDDLPAEITMNRDRSCISMLPEENDYAFDVGGGDFMMDFGAMSKVTGCGCIEEDKLKQIILNATLSAQTQGSGGLYTLRGGQQATLDVRVTPELTDMRANGTFYLNFFTLTSATNGDLEVNGKARLLTRFKETYVDVDIQGALDAAVFFGQSSMSGSGRLNWHLEAQRQWIQARLALEIISSLGGMGGEGGLFLGYNTPTSKIWVMSDEDGRFALDTGNLPNTLSGIYGYGKYGASLSLGLISGGYEGFVGLGAFIGEDSADVPSECSYQAGFPLPYVAGHCGLHVWGKLLGGVVSASAWGHLQLFFPQLFFKGTLGLKGCVAWVMCASIELSAGLGSNGFYFD